MVPAAVVPAPPLVGIHPNPGPRGGKRLPEEKKWRAVFRWQDNKESPWKIAKKLKMSHHTAKNIIETYKETKTVHERHHSGRKRKLSPSDTKKIVRQAKKGKCAPQITRECNKDVAERTIQRELKRAGFFYRKIKKVEKLTKRHKQLRVEYSNKMKGYAWRTILFSDEKTFQLGSGPEYAWQLPTNPITREYVTHAPKLHVWGAIGAHMKSDLFFFEENLNSELYQKILKHCITENRLTFAPKQKTKLRGKWQFLQDNSRVHKAKNSMKILDELVGDRLILHPPKSLI